ncbi:DNA gyrase inhibitor YacG [Mucisphaera calidilacus]|uniref:DNA gyrase inhibitor YacG n=1 Tax=Mucisphaera calidilacus TaxID=2527982 RepID=A0A518BVF2_9BACT|nr:zinc-binding protein [Mucisphaera calidilacus]
MGKKSAEAESQAAGKCAICREPIPDERVDMFCSDRCRTIDLGKWLDGSYTISRPIEQRDLEEGVD